MKSFVLHGNFIWSASRETLSLRPNAWAVCADGKCAGVFDVLPEAYKAYPMRELGDALVIPGYTDLHLHASQVRNMGLGMDLELIDWLNQLTFPEEARFSDPAFAEEVYGRFAAALARGFTTRAAVFATIHPTATLTLMEKLEKTGLRTLVGKVNMDRNCPDALRENGAEGSLAETERWLSSAAGRFQNTAPILTPRFVPSCTPRLMEGLAGLAEAYGLPVQSHLDENPSEIAWVRQLHPEYGDYASVYDSCGLLGPDTLMAHCIYLTDGEAALLRERGTYIVHCPTSNTNVRSGLCPVRRYLELGLKMGLGSDVSGGHTLDMAEVVRAALGVSKLLWRAAGEKLPHLRAQEAFWLATAGGASFFGKAGAFEPGYDFDAVAVDDSAWRAPEDDLQKRFEKMIYCSSGRDVKAKYVAGRKIF